jgi:hypothetical protein
MERRASNGFGFDAIKNRVSLNLNQIRTKHKKSIIPADVIQN